MNTVEFFCGTASFSKVMKDHGHNTLTIDNKIIFKPDLLLNILHIPELFLKELCYKQKISLVWFSPPCQAFSVANISRNWFEGRPISEEAFLGIALLRKSIRLIVNADPNIIWFIENPRGMMRTVFNKVAEEEGLKNFYHHEITYCQYGDDRMKPTDIWTNAEWFRPRPSCKNGDGCHTRAPRGSRTGTQGLKGSVARGVIPPALFQDILMEMVFNE